MTAIAVTIAGSDSGGGAGIQADLKTFSALGVYGASVVTALTAQNTEGVRAIHAVPADFVAAQMDAVFSDLVVDAVKIGMLGAPDLISAVVVGLERWRQTRVVLDPVMVATSGDQLVPDEAVAAIRQLLLPRAMVVTPNLPEAARLTGAPVATDAAAMEEQARRLLSLGPHAVLVKGGHGDGDESNDFLLTADGGWWLKAPRLPTKNTHGTGCTLSSAIAAGLAQGRDLEAAVTAAKEYVTGALAAADGLRIGKGRGPVHHFHSWWTA